MTMEKYFYCYSRPLKDFLVENGLQFIMHSIHDKTSKKFWVFTSNEQLNRLLDKWRLNKK